MSEYQYYEFQAIDRPLTSEEQRRLRSLSTRARISATSFVNTYNWGGFKGNPSTLMERYFDVFLYLANWGTRKFMVRVPCRMLIEKEAAPYCIGRGVSFWVKEEFLILDFLSEEEGAEDWEEEGWLSSLIPLRSDLIDGDRRALYLGWLLSAQSGELGDDEIEPPVPPGLNELTASLKSLVDFLRLDGSLVDVAAEKSLPLNKVTPSEEDLSRWIHALPESDKSSYLLRLFKDNDRFLHAELHRRFEQEILATGHTVARYSKGRTVGQLVSAAKDRAQIKRQLAAEQMARERARREREEIERRNKYLDLLVIGREISLWQQIETLVATSKPTAHAKAVEFLKDLRDAANRSGKIGDFNGRLKAFQIRSSNKKAFLKRMDRVGLLTRDPGLYNSSS